MNGLTPDELRDLTIIRGRALMDRGDIRPMLRITRAPQGAGQTATATAEVIPWLDALNMEVGGHG